MSAISDDPLRFLKPRKKQFHLTPTKPTKQSSTPSYNNNNTIIIQHHNSIPIPSSSYQNKPNKVEELSSLLTENSYVAGVTVNKGDYVSCLVNNNDDDYNISANANCRSKNIDNIDNSNKIYNPQKYFFLEVENYLRSKKGLPLINNNSGNNNRQEQQKEQPIRQNNQTQQSNENIDHSLELEEEQEEQQSLQESSNYILQQVESIRIKRQQEEEQQNYQNNNNINSKQPSSRSFKEIKPESVTSILMLETKHDNGCQREQKEYQEKYEEQSLSKKHSLNNPTNPFITKKSSSEYHTQEKRFKHKTYQEYFEEEEHDENQETPELEQEEELKPCPICNRKFNPNSYEKHIKVCEKVFYKKRKEFSSEKQRSLSNKRK